MNTRGIFGMIALSIALVSESPMLAQDNYAAPPVTVSQEKIKVNGRLCYSHVVLEKQTLYSISKAYGVSVEDIYKYNPDVRKNGLKKNSIIVIPAVAQGKEKKGSGTEGGENKSTDKAAAVNQQKEKEIAEGTVEKKATKKTEPEIHTVRWYETIETIASKYGVGVQEIMKANGLKDKELKSRQKLVIPRKSEVVEETPDNSTQEEALPTETIKEDNGRDDESENMGYSPKKNVRLSIALPFMAGSERQSTSSMDFYSGALLAARDLGNEGTDVEIDVYDIGGEAEDITAGKFTGVDFIVGPLAPEDIRRTYEVIGEDRALISPLDQKVAEMTVKYPKLIQVPPPHDFQYADLAQWIADEMQPNDRTILITEKGARKSESMERLVSMVDLSGIKYIPFSYSLLEGRDIIEGLKKITINGNGQTNRFIVASESEAFVNDVFRNIGLLVREDRKVEIFCHSKVRGYDIEVESLHNNNLHVSLAYYIDYNDPEVIRFVKQYRALFNTEPTQFSFQGYDIVKYFGETCAKYGNDWMKAIGNCPQTGLQTNFNFRDGSRINEGVRRIEYLPDYQIKSVE